MFRKKSTKELVRGASDDVELRTDDAPKREKKKRWKRDKEPNDVRQASFFRTKLFYGILCMAVGLAIALVGVPVLRSQTTDTVKIVSFAMDAEAGSLVTGDELSIVEVSSYHLPFGVVFDPAEAVGQYLRVDAVAGDYVTTSRLAAQYPGDDPFLLNLPEGKVAISMSLPDLSQSVSGKLRSGDVIQIFAVEANSERREADAPPELQYVEVLTVTYQDGVDVNDGDYGERTGSVSSDTLSTATLLVNSRQAATIAGLEKQATLYAALVVRGNEARKAAALEAQDTYFLELELAEEAAELAEEEAEPEPSGGEEPDEEEPAVEEGGV